MIEAGWAKVNVDWCKTENELASCFKSHFSDEAYKQLIDQKPQEAEADAYPKTTESSQQTILQWLKQKDIRTPSVLMDKFKELGVNVAADLGHLEEEDVHKLCVDMTKVETSKLRKGLKSL